MGLITSKAPEMFKVTVIWKVHGKYVWDHFHCRDSFVRNFVKKEMNWSFCCTTRPGKKTPENIEEILTDSFLRFVWTISNFKILAVFVVNSDQALIYYTAGAEGTYAAIGSKQVEVVGKDEWGGLLSWWEFQ